MAIRISRGLIDAIIADARATPDLERCGLLLGRCVGDAVTITAQVSAANVHAHPARHFELDPAALIAAERAARAGGPMVVGHYHSHPQGPAAPSATDAMAAAPDDRLWLIVNADAYGLWRSVADGAVHGRFNPETLAISD